MKKVKQVDFNWFFSPIDNQENWARRTVGQDGVRFIDLREDYNSPSCFVVSYEDGRSEWVYNINQVIWEPAPVVDVTESSSAGETFDLPF